MIGALLLACGLALAQGGVFERSLEATAEGRYSDALQILESNDLDPASRSQARFWALYRAGLPDLALAEAEAGLSVDPRDEWLLTQAVEVALILHDGGAAERHLAAWERSGGTPPVGVREEVAARLRTEELAAAGLRRAVAVTCSMLTLCAGLLAWWLRGPR